jgi:hypothetical protein
MKKNEKMELEVEDYEEKIRKMGENERKLKREKNKESEKIDVKK